MSFTTTGDRYDVRTIALHWATAVIVVVLWVLGQTADWFPDHGLVNTSLWSTHVVFGFVLAAILAWRILWRASGGRALPAADRGFVHVVAKATHYGLYLLLLVVVGLGVVNAFVRGYSIYGLVHLPQVGDPSWRRPVTHWHGLAANLTLALAGLHALAALVHHYLLRDGLLGRMMPGAAPPTADAAPRGEVLDIR